MIPVVYIHFGKIPVYLVKSIEQASKFNEEIILVSDTELKKNKVKSITPDKYNEGIDSFLKIYKHKSTNKIDFELMCINRWFLLRNVMNKLNIDVCYYSDSDVMIYDNMNSVYSDYYSYDAAYTLTDFQGNYRWSASACCSFWKREMINRFCDFIMEMYSSEKISVLEEKWNYHLKNNIPGGVCDMTLLYLFSQKIAFYPLTKVLNDCCFDQNMRVGENFFCDEYDVIKDERSNVLLKKIRWENNKPYAFNNVLKKEIRFFTLTEYAKIICNEEERKITFKKILKKLISMISNK